MGYPKSTMNQTAQAKEIEKAVKMALLTLYPNCAVQVLNSTVGHTNLNPPALEVRVTATFQVAEKTPPKE